MPGLSLDSFELVNCWAVQTLLEEWIASRATEGAGGEKLVEVNYKQFPKTFTSNLKGHNGTCWKRHMELMPDFAFIIFLPNIYCTISQLIATFCLFILRFLGSTGERKSYQKTADNSRLHYIIRT
jgi:hypothetical protein